MMRSEFGSELAGHPFTLIDLLRSRCRQQPADLAYTFLPDGNTPEINLTYEQLDRRARAIAQSLRNFETNAERVLLLYPPGVDFIAGFFGCLYARMIAVPSYPPDAARLNRSLPRLQAIVNDAQARIVLTDTRMLSMSKLVFAQAPELETLHWIATDAISLSERSEEWIPPAAQSGDTAFLQYTSGSTGNPKGVMLSHSNLLHNASLVYNAVEHTAADKYVSWLPMFHDMGFMAGVLQPLYAGIPAILMSPVSFLQDPVCWLQAISRYQATTSGGPNFAYDLCVRRINPDLRATLDLSSWSVAFNGAEPIHAETLDRFAKTFEPCGFRRETFFPCYGLAEATLIVSGGMKTATPQIKGLEPDALKNNYVIETNIEAGETRLLVGCGQPLAGQRIAIVDPDTLKRSSSHEVGEIWVSGPSVAKGYWNLPDQTEESFQAHISDTNEGPFLRTGDLGFLQDGQLFVTGRLKDLIIIRGLNHYPQDIEIVVEHCHPGLKPGCGAAFSIEVSNQEQLIVVQEVDTNREADLDLVFDNIRKAVAETHELQVYAIALIRPGTIPKTSSGKIQRRECRTHFLENRLSMIAEWRQSSTEQVEGPDSFSNAPAASLLEPAEIQPWLVSLLARETGVAAEEIEVTRSITQYGLDSLMAIEMMHGIESRLGIRLPMSSLLEGCSISELASQAVAQLARSLPEASKGEDAAWETQSPLSHGQRGLWFLHQIAPDSIAYSIARAARVLGAIDIVSMRRAFESLVSRHRSLRTTFSNTDSGPVQQIHSNIDVDFQQEDALGWCDSLLNDRLADESNRPFNLEQGPLLRVHLFKRSEQEHILLLVVHHIVSDFWSLAVFLQEFGMFYEAEVTGTKASLEPLPAQYIDYVRYQAEMLGAVEGAQLQSYWKEHLDGSPHVLDFPIDHLRPAVQTYSGASLPFEIDQESTQRIKDLAHIRGATLYVTLLAAFQTLLFRYTGQTDLLVGSPAAGREKAQFAGVIGYFINTVVLRADLSGDPTFEEFVDRVRNSVLAALDHQEYPFTLLVEQLQPERDPSRSPLFQAMFALQKTHLLNEELLSLALGETGSEVELGGLVLEPLQMERRVAQFDFTLMLAEIGGRLFASVEYNTDILDRATIARFAGHFQTLVRSATRDPQTRLSQLSLFNRAELDQFLFESNFVSVEYSTDTCIDRLFSLQVRRVPDAEALYFEGASLTYAELDGRANQLAHFLRSKGVGPEDLIGICMDRSAEMIVCLLAVLKSSAAFLPLDPAYPEQRLAFMIQDAGVKLALVQHEYVDALPEQIELICVDDCLDLICAFDPSVPETTITSQNLAYVVYTSGTTGSPKGTMISHEAAVNALLWFEESHKDDSLKRVAHKSSLSFDVSVWEIFWPLVSGGTVIVARPGGQYDPAYLSQLLSEQRVSTTNFPPAMLRRMIDENGLEPCSSLRYVACGGEAVPADLVSDFINTTGATLENFYGPTETTISSSFWECRILPDRRVLIGSPYGNTRIYILDETLQPVPIGVPGEIHIAGTGVARGYLGRPGLTAEKFIPDPFSPTPGDRVYKTGDLGRHTSDCNIEYIGRKDQQVKLRGYRIELDEIQHALRTHPHVSDSIVVAREDWAPGKHLVAYAVAAEAAAPSAADLRTFLKRSLPNYMVPSAFVFLDRLPLTPNGKVDQGVLPLPVGLQSELQEDFLAPRNIFEEVIAGVWADVLKAERISASDNFFNLGGHSLLATQVIFKLRNLFQVDLPVHEIFETPTVEGLAKRIRSAARGRNEPVLQIARASRDANLPLSFAQLRMWLLDSLEPGNTVYNIPVAVRLRGPLDFQTVERVVNEIVRRHEILRTRFGTSNGEPIQVIDPELNLSLSVIDLARLSETAREDNGAKLAVQEARQPFNLANGPLLRIRLLRYAEEDHVFLLTMHHIISDGWSLRVFLQEFAALYEAFDNASPSPLSELPIQYADFACWQREWLQGRTLEKLRSYWKQQLSGDLPVLDLPSDYTRPAVKTYEGNTFPIRISEQLGSRLDALSKRENVTLFMTLLSAFDTLLWRYTHQRDLLVGTPISGRNSEGMEGLIGCFINTLVIRLDLSGNPSFRQLLKRTRDACSAAYAHQDLPFERLVDELEIERSLSRNPLFQVMFELQTEITSSLHLAGRTMTFMDVERTTSKFDLTLNLIQSAAHNLSGYIEFSTDLFELATIERFAKHFQGLLEAIAEDQAREISQLSILTQAERSQLLYEWNDATEPRSNLCIHHLFEAQVDKTPDSVAVLFENESLTYRELDQRANKLAQYLGQFGVSEETRVGICLDRSLEMLVAMFGTLKAGGAYVPLDPSHPADRLEFMLEDSRATLLLTRQRLIEMLPERRPETVCLDTEWKAIAQHYNDGFRATVTDENLVYVLYTSGSTGRPKGVAVEHRQLLNYVEAVKERMDLGAVKSFALVSTFAADLGNTVLFPALVTGGCLHIVCEEIVSDADEMCDYFNRHSIDCVKIVPSHLASLRSFTNSQQVLSRKILVLGGEASQSRWVDQLQSHNNSCTIFNHYGPTEATVGVLTYRHDRVLPDHVLTLPLGRPLANTEIYLLDDDLQPVPIGVPGEILIGGADLARGYFNSPDQTAERFIPHPFGNNPGARLYKTGDLARYLPDGNSQFLGRKDNQVKIRGFRIEPGEIEKALRLHPAVREALVLAVGETNHDKRLVSHVVADREAALGVAELRSFLNGKLPEHMLPAGFIFLDSFPLTSNGKIDRRALPAPDSGSMTSDDVAQTPRSPVEELIANVWAQVLGLDRVGIRDDFFGLGGNSLLATQVVSRIRAALEVGLPLRRLFESPTVAGLADFIKKERTRDTQLQAPPIKKTSGDRALPLSYSQWRLWFIDQLVPDSPIYNVAVALRLSGSLDTAILGKSINEIVRRHEVLRTTFPQPNSQPVQVIAPALTINMPVIDLAHLEDFEQEEIVKEMANEAARQPFNLAEGPLLRVKLLRLGRLEHVLLLAIYHIACDDWSVGIFNRELSEIYKSISGGHPPSLAELEIQYADFACWQQEWLSGEVLAAEIKHWKNRLGDNPPVLDLPTDHARPAVQKYRGANMPFELDSSLAEALKAIGLQHGNTLFMTLLAAFAVLLRRYSRQEKITIGVPIANRNHRETEELIGFFTNVMVLLMDMSGNPSYKEMLSRAREVTLDAYDHQDMPFEKLVEAFHLKRDLSRSPLRQVAFAYEQASPEALNLPGVTVSRLPIESATSRLDLTLFMREADGTLKGSVEYNSDLFEPDTILRLIDSYKKVLADLAGDLERPILSLPLVIEERKVSIESEASKAAREKQIEDPTNLVYTQSNMAANQLLFWFGKKLQPDAHLYFETVIVKLDIKGAIERACFQAAFQELVNSSDALRSTITEVDGLPRRSVRDRLPFTVSCVDFSESENALSESERWLEEQYDLQFDFDKSLFDCALLKLSNDHFIWLLRISHMICDMWSVALIIKNVSEYYRSSLEGGLRRAEPMRPYQDYVEDEREFRQSDGYRKAESYWERKLAEAPNLPQFYRTDFSRETTLTERLSYELGVEQSERLKVMASRSGFFSPAITFAAVLFAYQHRLTGEQTLRIGSPLAYRPEAFRQTLGLFVNACPLQVTINEDESFLSLARKVQVDFVDTSRNQRYPVRTSIEGRVFNVYFNYQIASFTEFAGIPVEFDLIQTKHINDALTLQVRDFDASGSFVLDFNFNCESFDERQCQESMRHYLRLLEAFIENQDQLLQSASMLSDQEMQQILVDFNRTEAHYPIDRCLHHMIEEQAGLTPDSIAVIYEDQQLAYSELNRRANQLAHFLRRFGVGPEVYVGVCMERSAEMVIALLGTLKAGGAYVPIDPTYPRERLAFMLADAGVPVLLTQSSLADQLAENNSQIVCLDTQWKMVSGEPGTNPDIQIKDENLAYMIYTSGSTGKPKGVMISHAGIRNRVVWAQERYQLGQNDRIFQKTPFSFDPSVWEFLLPLIAGGAITLAAPGGQRDTQYMVKAMAESKATMLHFVLPMLRALLETENLESCDNLRVIIVGTEQVQFEDQEKFYKRLPWATLENLYGPTEASVDVTYWKCLREREGRMVPIGRPVANVKIHILDRHLMAVPVGVSGELHIGGIALMRGYHNRPELTAEKMVPNPYGDSGERLYNSGDVARYREDGEIEFLGRIDNQVKIRGYRIELGEIEAALIEHPAIREVVVVAREDKPGQKRVVAYFIPATGHAVSSADLRDWLKKSLPEYMIPAVFAELEAMPLAPNGKLNRRALPAPEQIQSGSEPVYEAPRTPLEKLLADIWMEVLDVEKVGINDDFFDVGGQSILATQFITRVQHAMPVELSLRAIFETPTIATLAAFITRNQPPQDEDQKGVLAELFAEIQGLSEEDVKELLREEQPESPEEQFEPRE